MKERAHNRKMGMGHGRKRRHIFKMLKSFFEQSSTATPIFSQQEYFRARKSS